MGRKRFKTNAEFIEECLKIHKGYYEYSNTYYTNSQTKIKVICPIHGEFEQLPSSHLNGKGCNLCAVLKRANKITKSFNDFKEKAIKIHGSKYTYDHSNYVNLNIPINIKCPIHGLFSQRPEKHLMGRGCRKCAKNYPLTTEEFIRRATIVHNDFYNYSNTNFIGVNRKLKIMCPIHGEFEQIANAHLKGCKCSKCAKHISQSETEIELFINELGYFTSLNNRSIISPFELDIYIPTLKKAIEFNGLHWHYSKRHYVPGKHSRKSKLCKEKGINLLHLREDLWLKDKEKMKEVIIKFLEYGTR